jgi:hypothetical protein
MIQEDKDLLLKARIKSTGENILLWKRRLILPIFLNIVQRV